MIQLLISYDGGCNYDVVNKDASTEDIASMYDTLLKIMINDYNQHHYWSLDESYIIDAVNVVDGEELDALEGYEMTFRDVERYLKRYDGKLSNRYIASFMNTLDDAYCKRTLIDILHWLDVYHEDYVDYSHSELDELREIIYSRF